MASTLIIIILFIQLINKSSLTNTKMNIKPTSTSNNIINTQYSSSSKSYHHSRITTKTLLIIQILLSLVTDIVTADKSPLPPPWPLPPFVDSCSGLIEKRCLSEPRCGWFQKMIPWCYDKIYITKRPPPQPYAASDRAKLFFEYNNGVHLCEGNIQKIWYNSDHVQCAERCIKSTIDDPQKIRCLSFDFHEFSSLLLPGEEYGRGICILNTENQDTARLRNVDQGYTDDELFSIPSFAGHYRLRTGNIGGYYSVRDPRGGQMATMLDYPKVGKDVNQIVVWGGSRWGITHLLTADVGTVPEPFTCSNGLVSSTIHPELWNNQWTMKGGYTPVRRNQKCPGLVTKTEAQSLCADTGGFLCSRYTINFELQGLKLGCSYDEDPVWAVEDIPTNPTKDLKFVRCCGEYGFVNTCETQYSPANLDYCSQFQTFPDCVKVGSGYSRQFSWGFGNLLQEYRRQCTDPQGCQEMLVQDWTPRDRCIWCLEPGTGGGQCRAGNHFGICKSTANDTRARFSAYVNRICGPATSCRLIQKYPDLCELFLGSGSSSCNQPMSPPTITTTGVGGGQDDNGGGITSSPCKSYILKSLCNTVSDQCKWNDVTQKCTRRLDIG
jgi:hypothetical protein